MTHALDRVRNGVDTEQLYGTLGAVGAQPELGRFRFGVRNQWLDGAHNRSTIQGFYCGGRADGSRQAAFTLAAGEPSIRLGCDGGPNPAEHLLHALAACLTTSLVDVAAAQNVRLSEVESTLEGEIDVRGALGLSAEVRPGVLGQRSRAVVALDGGGPAIDGRQRLGREARIAVVERDAGEAAPRAPLGIACCKAGAGANLRGRFNPPAICAETTGVCVRPRPSRAGSFCCAATCAPLPRSPPC